MTNPEPAHPHGESAGFDRGFGGHSLRQARMGLRLTPAERLRWLELTMEELRRLVGRAKLGRPIGDSPSAP
jgi:hypothetical protein